MDMCTRGLTTDFSSALSGLSKELMEKEFDQERYKRNISVVYGKYATDAELAAVLPYKCHID